jgi:hypothetical protein
MKILTAQFAVLIFGIFFTIPCLSQISVSEDFDRRCGELQVSVPPFYTEYLNANYNSISKTPAASSMYTYQLTLKHKNIPVEVRYNASPAERPNLETRLVSMARELGISHEKQPQRLKPSQYEFVGCDLAGRIYGRQSTNGNYEAAACYIYIGSNGFFEVTLFYNYPSEANKESFNKNLSRTLNAFRFAADVKNDDSFSGIGVSFKYDKELNGYKVLGVIKEGPADKAGILPGDQIYAVNGTKINKKDMSRVVNELRGANGSAVKVEVVRGVLFYNYEITRAAISPSDNAGMWEEKDYELEKLYFNNTVDFLLSGKLSENYKKEFIENTIVGPKHNFNLNFPGGIPGTVTINDDAQENLVEYTLLQNASSTEVDSYYSRYKAYLYDKYQNDLLFQPRETDNSTIVETVSPEWLTEHAVLIKENNALKLKVYRPFNLDEKKD